MQENDSKFISQENKANSLKQIIRSLCTYRVVKLIHYYVSLNEIIIGFKPYNLIRAIKNNSKQYSVFYIYTENTLFHKINTIIS